MLLRPPDHQLPVRDGHNVRCRSPTGVSNGIDHRLSVADRPPHLSRYGRLISGPGGHVLAGSDFGRGVRLISDAGPEIRHSVDAFSGGPRHNSILASPGCVLVDDQTRVHGTPDAKQAAKIRVEFDRPGSGWPRDNSVSERPSPTRMGPLKFCRSRKSLCRRVRPIISCRSRCGQGSKADSRFAIICSALQIASDAVDARRDLRRHVPST